MLPCRRATFKLDSESSFEDGIPTDIFQLGIHTDIFQLGWLAWILNHSSKDYHERTWKTEPNYIIVFIWNCFPRTFSRLHNMTILMIFLKVIVLIAFLIAISIASYTLVSV